MKRKSELEKFKLGYELTPNDDLERKITSYTKSLKLKLIKGGWLAQVRLRTNGERQEISEIANSPREALVKLDKRLNNEGLYDV